MREPKHDPQLNNELFNKYIVPNLETIRSLVFFYSMNKQDVMHNMDIVLEDMWKYIHHYDPQKKLSTWIHIVTKRKVLNINKMAYDRVKCHSNGFSLDFDYDASFQTPDELLNGGNEVMLQNVSDNISDAVAYALQRCPPQMLSAFMLYYQGYDKKEIARIEYERGYIDDCGEEGQQIIAHRIYTAKKRIKELLVENGITNSLPR